MAAYSSDSSNSTTRGFDITSSVVSSEDRTSIYLEKCPLCTRLKRAFYCHECIRNGDFTYSKANYPERFAEKKVKLKELNQTRQKLAECCSAEFRNRIKAESLHTEISECHRRLELLQLAIQDALTRTSQRKISLNQVRSDMSALQMQVPLYEKELHRLRHCAEQHRVTIAEHRRKLAEEEMQLQEVKRENVQHLFTYIFPIVEVTPVQRSQSSSGESSTSEAHLIELVESQSETHYRVIEPTLPANGDYSSYSLWITQHKDSIPVAPTALELRNPAYNISAALTYLTQLVSLLAFYLDVRLPKKLSFSEFCGHELTEEQFLHRVAMLNANVLHMCFSQNVSPLLLHPRHTVQNLLLLVDATNTGLGRYGPFEPDAKLALRMEESFAKDILEEDEKDEVRALADEVELGDWETVNVANFSAATDLSPAHPRGSYSTLTVPQNPNRPASTTTSIAGGFGLVTSAAASVASLWRRYV